MLSESFFVDVMQFITWTTLSTVENVQQLFLEQIASALAVKNYAYWYNPTRYFSFLTPTYGDWILMVCKESQYFNQWNISLSMHICRDIGAGAAGGARAAPRVQMHLRIRAISRQNSVKSFRKYRNKLGGIITNSIEISTKRV